MRFPEERARGSDLYCEFDGRAVELRPPDLTRAGVFISTTSPPELDRELDLLLRSPSGAIGVRAQVVQVISPTRAKSECRLPGFGVLFIDLTDDQRAFIGEVLEAAERAAVANRARAEERERTASRRASTLKQLEQELAALQPKSPWAMLGLSPNADEHAAREAYLALSKRYHPHVYAHLDSPEISKLATELFIAHKRAYTSLSSLRAPAAEPSRTQVAAEANAAPVAKPPPVAAARAAAEPRAEPIRGSGRVSAGKGITAPKAPSVEPQLRPAPEAVASGPPRVNTPRVAAPRDPTTPGMPTRKRRGADAESALQAGLKHLAAARFEQAEHEIERAETLAPDRRDVVMWLHVCRARQYKASGQDEGALREYRALLDLDPEHREALEYVGGRERRKVGGLIGKWFGSENE